MQQSNTVLNEGSVETTTMGGKAYVGESEQSANVEQGSSLAEGGETHMLSSDEMSTGRGESRQMQPQAIFGYCLLHGLRGVPMEDFHVADFPDIDGEEVGMFGVFDSHDGSHVGKYLQRHLFDNILSEGGVWSDPAGATRDGYLLTDRNILEGPTKRGGSTAVTAMLLEHGSRLIVANVGDSRAVISKNGKAFQLSVDHDPGRPVERANVEMRGGHVTHLPGDYWRVDGVLSIARAFGDKSLKSHMSAKPDVADLVVDLSCESLILGSNGLWAVYGNQEVVDVVNKIGDPLKAAQQLVHEARARHSEDDISCIVIQFREL